MINSHYLLKIFMCLSFLYSGFSFAGGPLAVVNGSAVAYPNNGRNLVLNFDKGTLGSRSNNQADALVLRAMGLWNNVSTSTFSISQGNDIANDVTATDAGSFINNTRDGLNPFIYDTDGSIIDSIFGVGQSRSILGVAGSSYFRSNNRRSAYVEGYLVLSGARSVNDDNMVIVMAHELGHFLGVDHSQLDNSQNLSRSNYVLMYPISVRTSPTLHEDDIQSISQLYPSTTLETIYSTVNGVFLNSNGSAKLGVNVWLQESSTGKVYSSVSDYLDTANGAFKILVPAGSYTLHAEAIDSRFFAGSSVGPHARTQTDTSFVNPIVTVDYNQSNNRAFVFKMNAGCSINVNFRSDGSGTNTVCDNTLVANNANLTLQEDSIATGVLTGTSTNPANLLFNIVTNGAKGLVTITNRTTGAYTYTPNRNSTGIDSFSFTVSDGTITSPSASVNISITNVNDAPVATNGNISITENTSIRGILNATDIDSNVLNFSVAILPTKGTIALNAITGAYTYISTGGAGGDSFTFTVNDGSGGTDNGVISINISAANNGGSTPPALPPEPAPVEIFPPADPIDETSPVSTVSSGGGSSSIFMLLILLINLLFRADFNSISTIRLG